MFGQVENLPAYVLPPEMQILELNKKPKKKLTQLRHDAKRIWLFKSATKSHNKTVLLYLLDANPAASLGRGSGPPRAAREIWKWHFLQKNTFSFFLSLVN